MTHEIDYQRDSFAEIVLKQREMIRERDAAIASQGERLLEVAAMNLRLRQDAELFMSAEHQRYAEILILVENGFHAHMVDGNRSVDARTLVEVFRDVFEYAEENKRPGWFESALEAMEGTA